MSDPNKIRLFEEMPISRAVMMLTIPTILSSLVMVIYSLADTYFVGMLDDPVHNAAVTVMMKLFHDLEAQGRDNGGT